jgi:hypothetical protein
LKRPIGTLIPTGQVQPEKLHQTQIHSSILSGGKERGIMGSLKKVSSEKFINRVYWSLRDYYADEEAEAGGQCLAIESFSKMEIIRMLEHIHDERFLNQIRTLLKLHIQKKGENA